MKKIFFVTLVILNVVACKKSVLELQPFNRIETSNAFNTETDVELALNGMYTGLRVSFVGTATIPCGFNILGDVLSDNLKLAAQGRQTLTTFSEWRYNGESTSNVFEYGYVNARRANAILENIDRFPAGAFKDNAKGEALAARALLYFNTVRVFSKTFEQAGPTDSAAPYITSTDPTILPKKELVSSFYTKLVADLTQALPLIAASNGVGRLNKAAVNALLSRVYLYMGDMPNCITASSAALGATPVVATIADFPKIWTDETTNGVIFKVINTITDNANVPGTNYFQITGGLIRSEYVVDFNLRQLFLASDVRTAASIQTSLYNGILQNHVVKYRNKVSGGVAAVAGVVDAKVLRSAEVLLNRAEAYQRSGNNTAALADLNLLKTNRYTGFVNIIGLTGTALLDEILQERRLELAFEGDRFWDLKRRNLPVLRDPVKGDRADGTGVAHLFATMNVGDHRFQLPFPSAEINFNTNLKQNPGYQ